MSIVIHCQYRLDVLYVLYYNYLNNVSNIWIIIKFKIQITAKQEVNVKVINEIIEKCYSNIRS